MKREDIRCEGTGEVKGEMEEEEEGRQEKERRDGMEVGKSGIKSGIYG